MSHRHEQLSRDHVHHHAHAPQRNTLMRIVVAALLAIALHFVPRVETLPLGNICQGLLYYLVVYLIIGYDILIAAIKGVLRGEAFDENLLMTVATLGAFGLALYEESGDYSEAIAVMLLYQIGEYFLCYTVDKSRKDIAAMLPGNADPDEVCVNRNCLECITEEAPTEDFITHFARIYTPVVCYGALILALLPPLVLKLCQSDPCWDVWFYRALTFLVISCPCALVISIPLTFSAGIGGAFREGILFKGANELEALSKVRNLGGKILSEEMFRGLGVVFKNSDPGKQEQALRISHQTMNIVWQNIILAIGVKVVCLVLGAVGIANMWLAIFADTGIMILAVLNALRALRVK